jgi:hypothetical protein
VKRFFLDSGQKAFHREERKGKSAKFAKKSWCGEIVCLWNFTNRRTPEALPEARFDGFLRHFRANCSNLFSGLSVSTWNQ